jgi:aminotransferase
LISVAQPAKRLKAIKASVIRRFFALARDMPNCINLSVGEPDFSPPEHILKAGFQAAAEGNTHYSPTNGIPELREALSQKVYKDCGLRYDPDSEILVTVGGTEAFLATLLAWLNPGEEVLVPNPGFVVYEPSALLAEGKPVHVPLLETNNFWPSPRDVTSLITEKSRVIVLNYPNNPTGVVLPYDQIAVLAKIAVERDLIVISDEVYEKIVYDGSRHYCLAAFPGMRERTLVVNSFSKTYAMTGLRVGYVCGPSELMSSIQLVHQYMVACVDTLCQHIALAALNGPQDFVRDMLREFDRRRHLVFKRLNEIDGFRCSLPKGAFYAFPNIEAFGMPSEKFAEYLAKEAEVLTVPGSAFGSGGENHVRLSYAASYQKLEEALNRMEKAVRKLL